MVFIRLLSILFEKNRRLPERQTAGGRIKLFNRSVWVQRHLLLCLAGCIVPGITIYQISH